ncbi:MAG: hypothetical protein Q9222_000403 [Ikaeria aurantiellina]
MFLLPWSTGGRHEKAPGGPVPSPTALWSRPAASEGSLLNRMKRKRGSSDEPMQQLSPMKRRSEHLSHISIPAVDKGTSSPPNVNQAANESMVNPSKVSEDRTDRMDWQPLQVDNQKIQHDHAEATLLPPPQPPVDTGQPKSTAAQPPVATLRETIETQFSLEILLKHRELRLIDQEIAKCQVALEQLRRCQQIPYPAMPSSWEHMQAVAKGTGVLQENTAQDAPPWGVTSGPYTRHYRHWLIPDASFGDSVSEDLPVYQPSRQASERSVRASTAGKSHLASKSRSQRGAGSARLKALPHGYPDVKEDKGPMIVKRSTDGQMVKLICLDCRRSDFNSVQGFINHCRIAHSRNFQSHDAAAVACGEEIELDQTGGVVGETSTAINPGIGLVHPLIRSAHVAKSAAPTPPVKFGAQTASSTVTDASSPPLLDRLPGAYSPFHELDLGSGITPGPASSGFKPSPQTPHLSALLAKVGHSGDLENEVSLAKTKIDLDLALSSDDESEDEGSEVQQPPNQPTSHSTRGPVRPDHPPSGALPTPAPLERSPCVNIAKSASRRPNNLAIVPSRIPSAPSPHMHGIDLPHSSQPSFGHNVSDCVRSSSPNLSPNTVETHQAPSLISDDDEYENTHSECSSTADVAEDLEDQHYLSMAFGSHDDHAMDDLEGAGSSAGANHFELGGGLKAGQPAQRSSAMRAPNTIRDSTASNGRRVSFASPVRRSKKKAGKGS